MSDLGDLPAIRHLARTLDALLAEDSLQRMTLRELRTLSLIAIAGSTEVKTLAIDLDVSKSVASRALAALTLAGLTKFTQVTEDRRRRVWYLTLEGVRIVKRIEDEIG